MKTYWHGLIRYEAQKVHPKIALRNALGIGIPLAIGVAIGQPAGGLLACIGALDVAYSDGSDPYQFRARRMVAASLLVAAAIFAGALAGASAPTRLAVLGAAAFAAGMMPAVSQLATDIANITLVTIIVFSAHPMAIHDAQLSALAALAGALFQTGLAVAWWPVDRYLPERRALARLYRALARAAASARSETAPVKDAPVASAQSTEAQRELGALGGDGSVEAERYLMLLSQAERIRLSLVALTRVRIRRAREGAAAEVERIDAAAEEAAGVLDKVAEAIETGSPACADVDVRMRGDGLLDGLAGQLRSAADLASHATPTGLAEFARAEASQRWTLRVGGALASLRANLHLHSAAFRHAVRLAVVVPAAELLASDLGWQRPYWAPMTAAIVLRPDFAGTFTRSLLRVAGTLVGLGLATALFLSPPAVGWQVALLVAVAFVLRCWGPANYGIFAVSLTALIVLLLAATGVPPGTVIAARGINTMLGGAIALAAYRLWPTWERTQVNEVLAQLLEAYRAYFRAVGEAYLGPPRDAELDRARLAARLARSNADASMVRVREEPGTPPDRQARLDAMMANCLRLIHAAMALEAVLYRRRRSHDAPASRKQFRPFMEHVDLTLHYLAAVLGGSTVPADHLPDLRADHRALVEAGAGKEAAYAPVNIETDRITNSVNTLAKEILG